MANKNTDPWTEFITDNAEFIGAGLVILFVVALVLNAVGSLF